MSIRRLGSGGPWEDAVGYSRLVVAPVGEHALTAGCTATVDGALQHEGDAYRQALVAFDVALTALGRAGFGRESVVRSRMYVVDLPTHHEAVSRAHAEMVGSVRPAATMVGVAALLHPAMLVEVELEAVRAHSGPGAAGD